jgi:hypothetical protein
MAIDAIEERDKRTVKRRLAKKKFDDRVNFASTDKEQKVRLLDEGVVTYSDGSPYMFIEKGTIEKYVASLSSDFVGYITLGHLDMGAIPLVLGTWTRDDLEVEDIGNGRKALNVSMRLDYSLSIVRDLAKMPFDMAVSVEMYTGTDPDRKKAEKLADEAGYYVPCINDIDIIGFSVVGDGANVESNGITLSTKGVKMEMHDMDSVEKLKQRIAELESIANSDAESVEETVEEEATEVVEDVAEEEASETVELDTEEILSALKKLSDTAETMTAKVEELSAQLAERDKEIEEMKKAQLETSEKNKDFIEQFKNLSISLSNEPKKPEVKREGIDDIFSNPIGG